MKTIILAALALTLAACQNPGQSDLSQENRVALIGALLNRPQPQPYYHQPYMMPTSKAFSCSRVGSTMYCN